MSTSITKRVAAIVGAAALGVVALVGSAAPAFADVGNINPNTFRSLTIHKHTQTSTNGQTAGTGQEITGSGNIANLGAPIANVEFTIKLVPGIDLTTNAGWAAAQSKTVSQAQTDTAAVTGTVKTTDANGLAVFNGTGTGTGLPMGLYLVTESNAPSTVTNRAQPFLVTVPYPTQSTNTAAPNDWVYNVHVYPKNSVTGLSKSRITPAAGTAEALNPDLIRWNVVADIPTLPSSTPLSNFIVTDTVDKTQIPFVESGTPSGVTPTGVNVTNSAGTVQSFTAGTSTTGDYYIAYADGTAPNRTLTLTFNTSGLTKLKALGAGKVTLSVLTRAVAIPANGALTNNASSTINNVVNTTTANTSMGALEIFAYAPTGTGLTTQTPLAGAVFELYPTAADAAAGTNKITINGANSWTTNTNGEIILPAVTPGTGYYAKEITPPVGYSLPTTTVTQTTVVAGNIQPATPQNYYAIPHNQVVPAWMLPLTGGDGALWFGIGGGALIAIALGAAVVFARRRRAAETQHAA